MTRNSSSAPHTIESVLLQLLEGGAQSPIQELPMQLAASLCGFFTLERGALALNDPRAQAGEFYFFKKRSAAAQFRLTLARDGSLWRQFCAAPGLSDFELTEVPAQEQPEHAVLSGWFAEGFQRVFLSAGCSLQAIILLDLRDYRSWTPDQKRMLDLWAGVAGMLIENRFLKEGARAGHDTRSVGEASAAVPSSRDCFDRHTRHEINNFLCNITLTSQVVRQEILALDPEMAQMLNDMVRSVRAIQDVLSGFMTPKDSTSSALPSLIQKGAN